VVTVKIIDQINVTRDAGKVVEGDSSAVTR
jgi:hypothetical protein